MQSVLCVWLYVPAVVYNSRRTVVVVVFIRAQDMTKTANPYQKVLTWANQKLMDRTCTHHMSAAVSFQILKVWCVWIKHAVLPQKPMRQSDCWHRVRVVKLGRRVVLVVVCRGRSHQDATPASTQCSVLMSLWLWVTSVRRLIHNKELLSRGL